MTFSFKHSGTTGDLIYSLPIVKYFGGQNFYLHLDQINWIGQYYYGSSPQDYHKGRMNSSDFEFLKDFMLFQDYIEKFEPYDSKIEITHNLDRFRQFFVGHPGNYIDIYCSLFGIKDTITLRNTPWLSAPKNDHFKGKIVVNYTGRWVPQEINPQWTKWKDEGLDKNTIFIGFKHEYEKFIKQTGWSSEYLFCKNLLEQATAINSSDSFIGNQSAALAVAIGLGKSFYCESRKDLPKERNECYFPNHPNGIYF